jgi:hypothetical protein
LLAISGGFLAVLSRYCVVFPFPGEPTCKGVVAKMTDSDPKMSLPSTFASGHGCSLNTHRSSTSLRLKKLLWSKPRGRIREIFNYRHETRDEPPAHHLPSRFWLALMSNLSPQKGNATKFAAGYRLKSRAENGFQKRPLQRKNSLWSTDLAG